LPYTEIGVYVIAVPHGILSLSSLRTVESVGESQKAKKRQRKESHQKKNWAKRKAKRWKEYRKKNMGKKEKVEERTHPLHSTTSSHLAARIVSSSCSRSCALILIPPLSACAPLPLPLPLSYR
jgi:hypothetical protein